MRTIYTCALLAVVLAGAAYADLQNVQVGMQLEIRMRWYHDAWESGITAAKPQPHLRIPGSWMPGRVTGQANLGGNASDVWSMFRYNDKQPDWAWAEMATSLSFKADFTNNVNAMVEFYSFDNWGEDFRSNYLTGIDTRAVTADDVEILQSYIEVNKVFDQPLRLRIGRQVMQFGKDLSCFLIAGKTSPTNRYSFDGIRATYTGVDKLTVDAWWMKLADISPLEEDGDTDFYGVYGTYAFSDAANLSLYWMFLRDAHKVQDTAFDSFSEHLEDLLGKDNYPVTAFHTVGFQFQGKHKAWDYNLQVAYQFGDAGTLGVLFQKPWWYSTYGDDDAKYDNWGMEGSLGYTTATKWKIRPYIAGNWFQGQDNRDLSFQDWLHPLKAEPRASVSFNRLFSDINYCPVINDNADMTNYWQVGGGVSMAPTDKLAVTVRAYNTFADKTFDWPIYREVPRTDAFPAGRRPIAPFLSFLTKGSDNNLGFSIDTIIRYAYSKDLTLLLYYGHLFTGQGLRDGAFVNFYGTMMNGGLDDHDADYVFAWAILKF
jgi:opacity protein-like surface antigen